MRKKKIIKWVKREDAIKALRVEPLAAREFFRDESNPYCSVCAVGAVMRHVSFEKSIKDYLKEKKMPVHLLGEVARDSICKKVCVGDAKDKKDALKLKNYLGALSIHFEKLCSNRYDIDDPKKNKKIRKSCISFIRRNFPKRFRVTAEV